MRLIKKIFLLCLFLLAFSIHAKVSVVFFPLENRSYDKYYAWMGYSFPEIYYRVAAEDSKVQIWDPVFMFTVDTTGWRLDSDSLTYIHQKRWKWDYALGGYYAIGRDSVWITLRIIKKDKDKDKLIPKIMEICWPMDAYLVNCLKSIPVLFRAAGFPLAAADSAKFIQEELKNSTVYATYAAGYGYEMQGALINAISAYTRVLDMNAVFPPALFRLGLLYNRSRNMKAAQELLEKALVRSSASSTVHALMAEFLLSGNDQNKAQSFIESKRQLLERTSGGMKTVGLWYVYRGEYQRAISILTRAVAEGPSDLEVDFALGKAYLYMGQFSDAANIFSRLIEYRPRYTRYYSFLGEAYREAGRLMESGEILERARKLDSMDVPNLINLANTYFRLGWYEKTEQYLLQARELNPSLNEIYINLGVVYWHTKRWDRAREMFAAAAGGKIHAQAVWNNEANILFLSGDIKKAIKFYKKADKTGGKSSVIIYNLALAYLTLGNKKEALRWFDEVLQLAPGRIDVLFIQAQLAADMKLDKNAEIYYRKILDLSPGNTQVMERFIELLERQKRYNDAIVIVETYLSNFPQDREFQVKLPDLYLKIGWYEVALEAYRKMLQDRDFTNNAKVVLGLSKSMYDLIRYKKARDYDKTLYYLKIAAQLDSSNYEPYLLMGNIYYDYKNYAELALENWEKAYQKVTDPEEKRKIMDMISEVKK